MKDNFNSQDYLNTLDKYFRASNYLSTAQLYLLNNPLLKSPLAKEDIKKNIVGHWGTCPNQNFVYTHCNRVIKKYDLDMILISGPGHGGNFFISNSYLEGTYSETYPDVSQDEIGMTKLCKQFSFAYGTASHVAPEVPGSIHEGGELGYSLAHAFGAVLDNPDLIATTIVGDGEAETGPLATSWHSNKFINPAIDGAVLPILNLNGFKISNPTILSRIPTDELKSLFIGYGYEPIIVSGSDPIKMHKLMANAMDKCIEKIKKIQAKARSSKQAIYPKWPMIILRTPKGWTGPKIVDGKQVEGSFLAHQIPIKMTKPEDLKLLEDWLKSYKPEELFDDNYKLKQEIADILPKGDKRISANKHANGGLLLKELVFPKLKDYEVKFNRPGQVKTQDMLELGGYIRDVFALNDNNKNFRIFSPDEAMSNRLYKVFEQEKRNYNVLAPKPTDENLSPVGRIMDSYLSEHMCEGWLEGYLLTGRHGLFDTYEAFARIVDSMISQHSKWLKVCNQLKWRAPIASLNLILTSNVWQQDHNGFSHQDPGFLNHLASKSQDVVNIYLPADANTLLATFDKCIQSKNKINAIVASKHPSYQWLNMKQAKEHLSKGISVWDFACLNNKENPDVVIACAGDNATLESIATVKLIKQYLPNTNVRFVNVLNLMTLSKSHPDSIIDEEYIELFGKNTPVIFNFHGYNGLIKELIFDRPNTNFIINGYHEEGSITTPFDMRVRNKIDRFNNMLEVLEIVKCNKSTKQKVETEIKNKLQAHLDYIKDKGVDLEEIENWNFND